MSIDIIVSVKWHFAETAMSIDNKMTNGLSFKFSKAYNWCLELIVLIYILYLGLNSSGNSDMKVMWMKIPADND